VSTKECSPVFILGMEKSTVSSAGSLPTVWISPPTEALLRETKQADLLDRIHQSNT